MSHWWHDERIRERAYAIWEREGRPADKAEEHWRRAEAEIAAEEKGLAEEIKLESQGVV